MAERLHLHVPFRQLEAALPDLLARGVQPEIAFQGPELDRLDRPRLRRHGAALAAAGLAVSIHAPFLDLNPGALEPLVATATRRRLEQTLEAAALLGATPVVVHPGYEFWKYGGQDHLWLERSLDFWPPLLARAAATGCRLALENVFETGPQTLAALLDRLDSPQLGHCLDVGHWHLFSKLPLAAWFAALGERLIHLHLHDNHGRRDDHLPPGEGRIDFPELWRLLGTLPHRPTATLEIHQAEGVSRALAAVAPFFSS